MRYTPRLTAPSRTDKRFIHYLKGGYNTCVMVDRQSGYVLPNCVGYAQGRLLEIRGENKADWKLPACNAEDWSDTAKTHGLQVGNTPKLGAVVCWRAGSTHNSADGAGHVAVVEEIKANGDIIVSQSAYGGKEFYLSTLTKASGYTYSPDRQLVGFIYCGIEFENDMETDTETDRKEATSSGIKAGLKVELRNVHAYSSESALSAYGTRSGIYYLWDGTVRNGRVRLTNSINKVGVPGQVSFWVTISEIGLADTGNTDKNADGESKNTDGTNTGNANMEDTAGNTSATPIAGTKYTLNNTPVYGTEKGPSIGKRSGIYYTWDATVRNGRIRMTNSPARVGVPWQVSFWVEVNKLL